MLRGYDKKPEYNRWALDGTGTSSEMEPLNRWAKDMICRGRQWRRRHRTESESELQPRELEASRSILFFSGFM